MVESYKNLLDKMREYLSHVPYEQGTRGYQKRLFILHYDEVRQAEQYLNQKDLVEKISNDLGVKLSHTYVNRILSEERKKRSTGTKEPVATAYNTAKKIDRPKVSHENKPTVEQEEKADALGRNPFPIQEITEEKLKEWEHLNLPKFAHRKLVTYGVNIEEYDKIGIRGILSSSAINNIVNEYCNRLESQWLRDQLLRQQHRP